MNNARYEIRAEETAENPRLAEGKSAISLLPITGTASATLIRLSPLISLKAGMKSKRCFGKSAARF